MSDKGSTKAGKNSAACSAYATSRGEANRRRRIEKHKRLGLGTAGLASKNRRLKAVPRGTARRRRRFGLARKVEA